MFWFVLRYAIWSLLLFALVYFKDYSPLYLINALQTEATVYVTELWVQFFDIPVTMENNTVVFAHGLQLLILDECNGLTPLLLYMAAILAYPTPYALKLKWLFGGMLLLLTLNMLRIILITLTVIEYPESFELAHNVVGRYGIGAATLFLFYYFTTHVSTCVPYGIVMNGKNCHASPSIKH